MARTLRLFVYGTLQPQARTRMGAWAAARQIRSEPAIAPGRLCAIRDAGGWFPALLRGGRGVPGDLCELRLRAGELSLLDRYEGREYRRVALRVRIAGGRHVCASAYLWRVTLPPGALRIEGGFLGWLRRRRHKAYSPGRRGA